MANVDIIKIGPHGGPRTIGTGSVEKGILTTKLVLDGNTVYQIEGKKYHVQQHVKGTKEGGGFPVKGNVLHYLLKPTEAT